MAPPMEMQPGQEFVLWRVTEMQIDMYYRERE